MISGHPKDKGSILRPFAIRHFYPAGFKIFSLDFYGLTTVFLGFSLSTLLEFVMLPSQDLSFFCFYHFWKISNQHIFRYHFPQFSRLSLLEFLDDVCYIPRSTPMSSFVRVSLSVLNYG